MTAVLWIGACFAISMLAAAGFFFGASCAFADDSVPWHDPSRRRGATNAAALLGALLLLAGLCTGVAVLWLRS